MEIKCDKSECLHVVLTKLSNNTKQFKDFFLLEVKIELKKVSGIKSFLMNVLSDHEFSVLKTIFMFEVNSIFHFLKFGPYFLAEFEFALVIEELKIVFQEFRKQLE